MCELSKAKLVSYLNKTRRMEADDGKVFSSFEELLKEYGFIDEKAYNEALVAITLIDENENVTKGLNNIATDELDNATENWLRLFVRLEYLNKNEDRFKEEYEKTFAKLKDMGLVQ